MSKTFPPGGLQELILDRKRDRTYVQLEKDCGGTPTKSNIQRLATGPIVDMPTTEVMRGLAKGLRVRIGDIVRAAAISVGLPMGTVSPNDLVIVDAGLLPADSQQALMDTAANMLWWMEQVAAEAARESDAAELPLPDNVRHLPTPDWTMHAADSEAGKTSGQDIDPDQLPDE